MPHVNEDNQFVAFIVPDNADVHVDTAFKQIFGSLDAFGAQRRMNGVFSKKPQFVLELFFLLPIQVLKVFSNRLVNVI